MQHRQERHRLFLKPEQNLNLLTARHIERMADDVTEIYLDLSHARIIDSEGVILLYRLLRAGKKIFLKEPPPILAELVHALDLESVIPLSTMVQNDFKV